MKRVYERPLMTAELFEANEYVAACWGVACNVDAANAYEVSIKNAQYDEWKGTWSGQYHAANDDGTGCGHAANQYIVQTADGFKMTEVNTSGLGDLDCTVTQFTDADGNGLPDDGTLIYWTTTAGSGNSQRSWHHQGTVNLSDTSRPNHS